MFVCLFVLLCLIQKEDIIDLLKKKKGKGERKEMALCAGKISV
jgi:hypothetical protein